MTALNSDENNRGKMMGIPNMRNTSIGMIFRGVYLPIEYLPLSRGDSLKYFLQEFIAALMIVTGVAGGYYFYGLLGAGIGIALASFIESIFVMLFSRYFYGYRPSRGVMRYLAIHLLIIAAAYYVALNDQTGLYWVAGTSLFALSLVLSLSALKEKYSRGDSSKK